jgi:hypothetical protein
MTNAVSIAQQGSNNTTFRNRIINGAMTISQRNGTSSVSVAATGSQYTLDRYECIANTGGTYSAQQITTAPAGFSYSLGLTVTGTSTPSAGHQYTVEQYIEGYNIADINFGTANAKATTLSFWVYTSLTGTYSVALLGGSTSYVSNYTVSSANTWTQITVAVPAQTGGSSWNTTNGRGLSIYWDLGSGSTLQTSTLNAWQSGTYTRSTTANTWISNSGATFYITGVQLEAGSTASPFENRSYGVELALCQRYFWNYTGQAVGAFATGQCISGTVARIVLKYPVPMRTSPTISYTGALIVTNSSASGLSVTAFGSNYGGANSLMFDAVVASGLGAGNATIMANTNSSDAFSVTAEL